MSAPLLCLSLLEGILGWRGPRAGLQKGSGWWQSHLEASLQALTALCCSPSVIHHVACAKPEKSQAKKKTACPFCSICFLHFALFEELLDQFLLSVELGQFLWLSCADKGYRMLPLSAQRPFPQVMCAH